jgi:hypothetical protein
MSMFDILDNAKELACLAGSDGILWTDIAAQLSIASSSPIASYVFQRLRQSNYTIESRRLSPNDNNDNTTAAPRSSSSLSSSSSSPRSLDKNDFLITASLEDRCRAVGKMNFLLILSSYRSELINNIS